MEDNLTFCSSCLVKAQNNLSLDCSHFLCLICLSTMLQENEIQQMLTDQLEILCPECECRTCLPLSLGYKLVRGVRAKHDDQMVCFDCLASLFSVQEYTNGKHRDHQVKTVDSACPIVKNILQVNRIALQQSVESLGKQKDKLLHCKVLMHDVMTANMEAIQFTFDKLRQQIYRKQVEVINIYQEMINASMRTLNTDISNIQQERLKYERYLKSIYAFLEGEEGEKQIRYRDKLKTVLFYINNNKNFITLGEFQQKIKQKIEIHFENLRKSKKQIVAMQNAQQIFNTIRQLNFFQEDQIQKTKLQETEICLDFTQEYFANKRKELHNNLFVNSKNQSKSNTDLWFRKYQCEMTGSEKKSKIAVKLVRGKQL